jgi:hypothetical protein
LNRTPVQKQLLGQGRFTRVGVGDNRKIAPLLYRIGKVGGDFGGGHSGVSHELAVLVGKIGTILIVRAAPGFDGRDGGTASEG